MTTGRGSGFDINSLYHRSRDGDSEAERRLLEHLTVSFRLFTQHRIRDRQDAKEIVQDALMTITEKHKSMVFESSFAAWAYKILTNKILDHVKINRSRRSLMEQIAGSSNPQPVQNPDPELRTRLIDCFRKISNTNNRHARILNLHYQGYTTGEICKKLKISQNNFYVLLSRARAALEICLDKGGPSR